MSEDTTRDVRVGQVWEATAPRDEGLTVRVDVIRPATGAGYPKGSMVADCTVLTARGGRTPSSRQVRIRVDRLCAKYKLVREVPTSDSATAAELLRLADEFEVTRAQWREEDGRTIRSSALGHAIDRLRARATELNSGGAR